LLTAQSDAASFADWQVNQLFITSQIQTVFLCRNTGTEPVAVQVSGDVTTGAFSNSWNGWQGFDTPAELANCTALLSGPGVHAIAQTSTIGLVLDESNNWSDQLGEQKDVLGNWHVILPGQTAGVAASVVTSATGHIDSVGAVVSLAGASISWSTNVGAAPAIPTLGSGFTSGGTWQSGPWTTVGGGTGTTPPNGSCAYAFLPARPAPTTISIASPGITLGQLAIDGTSSYTITGPGTLTMACPSGVSMDVIDGQHTISADTNIANNVTFTVNSASNGVSSLSLVGGVNYTPGIDVSKFGTGKLVVPNVRAANLQIFQGTVEIAPNAGAAGVSRVNTLTVFDNATNAGTLNLSNNALVVDYSGTSPLLAIRDLIVNGYAAGTWTGHGITGTVAANKGIGYIESSLKYGGAPGTFLGESVDTSALIVWVTLKGDSNVDGAVNFTDLLVLSQNYNSGSGEKKWFEGDSSYDGYVNFTDLLALSQNYNTSQLIEPSLYLASFDAEFLADWALAASLVPEPGLLSVLSLGAFVISRRRA
jgi:Dockerin type I domain